jgi:hypothetical protein
MATHALAVRRSAAAAFSSASATARETRKCRLQSRGEVRGLCVSATFAPVRRARRFIFEGVAIALPQWWFVYGMFHERPFLIGRYEYCSDDLLSQRHARAFPLRERLNQVLEALGEDRINSGWAVHGQCLASADHQQRLR